MKPILNLNQAVSHFHFQPVQVFHDDLEPAVPTHQRRVPQCVPHTLALGTTDYGTRFYLDGQPLYDGSKIALEVFWGWIEGLFTWTGDPKDQPKLVFFGGQPTLVLEPDDVLCWINPLRCYH